MAVTKAIATRQTKYTAAVIAALQTLRHATNLELLYEVQKDYPEVSATTIHRVTARLKDRGVIACAPKPNDGSERYDINPRPHHHFMCVQCGQVRDVPETPVARLAVRRLKALSGECALAGTLTMLGVCKHCVRKGETT